MKKSNKRYTIGYFTNMTSGEISASIFNGIFDGCKENKVNFKAFVGSRLAESTEGVYNPIENIIYQMANLNNIDGLVIWPSPLNLHNLNDNEKKAFFSQISSIPMVSLAMQIFDAPLIQIDNRKGIRDLMMHLIEVHNCKNIGFVRGEKNHLYSEERFSAYKDCLVEYNIPYQEKLVTPWYDFNEASGKKAVDFFFKQNQLKPKSELDAIITATDKIAVTVINELKKIKIDVPVDVAVVGFNNKYESKIITPNLTTIEPNFYLQGKTAVSLLVKLLNGKKIANNYRIPTSLIIRSSCGCFERYIEQAEIITSLYSFNYYNENKSLALEEVYSLNKDEFINMLKYALPEKYVSIPENWSECLLDYFINDLLNFTSNRFMYYLENLLGQVKKEVGNFLIWQNVMSTLLGLIYPYLNQNDKMRQRADSMIHQARILISIGINNLQNDIKMNSIFEANLFSEIGRILISTFDLTRLMDKICYAISKLGITGCYLSVYEDPMNPLTTSRLLLAVNNKNKFNLAPAGKVFNTNELVPAGYLDQTERHELIILPLYVAEKQLGFVVFEITLLDKSIYEILRADFSSALQGVLFIQQREATEEALRKSEVRFRSMVETSSDWVWEIDDNLIYKYTSPRVKTIIGYDPREVIGRNLFDFMTGEQIEIYYDLLFKIIKERKPITKLENEYFHKNGQLMIIETTGVPVYDLDNNFIGYQGIHRNITEYKQAERERDNLLKELAIQNKELEQKVEQRTADLKMVNIKLQMAIDEATKATEAKSRFLANMSHEIRTPINGIIGMTELIMETNLDANQKKILQIIAKESNNLLVLINDILDFSKIEAGKIELELNEFDLRTVIEDITNTLFMMRENKRLEIICYLDPNYNYQIVGDMVRFRQILMNLAGNALKFTDNGEIYIKAEIVEENENQIKLIFSVKDTGIGISKEKQPIIFKEFTQADSSMTRKYGGTGLGTTISKQLVELMGGEIGLESEEGKGSNFWFTAVFSRQKRKSSFIGCFMNLRILIVENNTTIQFVMKEYIKSWGCIPESISTGNEALFLLNRSIQEKIIYHLIIIDIQLDDINGFELTRQIKNQSEFSHIPIILITSVGVPGDSQKCLDLGVQGYIHKPIKYLELHQSIKIIIKNLDKIVEKKSPVFITQQMMAEVKTNSNIKILLVEDYPTNQVVALHYLQKSGFQVELAKNGTEAVEAFRQYHYHLIFMDIQMPDMDGFIVTNIIRTIEAERNQGKPKNKQERIPIIAMTAHVMEDYKDKCLQNDMDDYITKPLKKNELLSKISQWTKGR